MNTYSRSSLWLPLLFVVGALVLTGCGATAPVVQSVSGPDTLETEESGTFEASINQEADEPLSYTWSFGDGASASGLLATHSYDSGGRYAVQFRASNEGGADADTLVVTVVSPQPASITSINANPNPVDEGERVRFSSNVQGDRPISYAWDVGDGSTTHTGASPTHTYEEPGQYTVRLRASNEAGTDSRTLNLRVNRVLPEVCTRISEMNSAHFERNSSTLTMEAEETLTENADILSKCPNLEVRIEAFAAPGERNAQALSDDRAEAVSNFYRDNGISGARISTSGEGRVEGVTSKKGGTRQYRRADSIPTREGDM